MIIMKLGGSSIGTGQRMLHAAEVVKSFSNEDVIIVISAIQGVTDTLIRLFQNYKSNNLVEALDDLRLLYNMHKRALYDLRLKKDSQIRTEKTLLSLFGDLNIYLALHSEYSVVDYDYVISFGEKFNSYLVSAALNKIGVIAKPVDASYVIVTDNTFNNAKAFLIETTLQAKRSLLPLLSRGVVPVVTGFFGATKEGKIATLGRGGSDYSATILANVLDAREVILWKEIDGVYSDDPKKNIHSKFYKELSYSAALALAEQGAKVLHPEAIKPIAVKEIPLWVKNTFKPNLIGTKIWKGV